MCVYKLILIYTYIVYSIKKIIKSSKKVARHKFDSVLLSKFGFLHYYSISHIVSLSVSFVHILCNLFVLFIVSK